MYVIEHVAGKQNVWADILTRWTISSGSKNKSITMKALILAPITPSLDKHLDWPKREDFETAQKVHNEKAPGRFTKTDGIFQDSNNVVFIPDQAETLQLRILVAAHTGLSGHRGYRKTRTNIKQHFWWKDIHKQVELFCKSSLHCLLAFSGDIIPRPLGHTIHASRLNEILLFDFCYLTPEDQGYEYVLVLKHDFSGYV